MNGLRIEEIAESDIPKVTELIIRLWPECSYEEESLNCQKIIDSHNQTIFSAKQGNNLFAFVHLSLRTDHVEGCSTSPVVYVEGLFVEPLFRKQGVGKALLRKAEEWGKDNNCSEIASDAEIQNIESLAFHKSIGFKEVNRIVCFSKKIS
jgi:aminoglycoside 6'-N-acetyltransferase I